MRSKPFYASLTIWYNALTIIVAVATFYGWTPNEALSQLISHVLVAASPAINVLLRFRTQRPITISNPS